ncbi:protein FAM124B [Nothoprocta perdicaria]|uniref:protein FAM124B n=1 Tax=Nothoprocta perdicaria TaxID=30464 RepID=UPI000E1BB692|nr:protein FAM124B [Nothoprocta perdicaria]
MGDRADPLLMTVHLLANSGRSSLLQQTLDRLLGWICPGTRLFLVSECATPLKYYESFSHGKRSRGFPGMSVLLFLHEDSGAERICQVHDIFQHPPWRYQRLPASLGQSPAAGAAREPFYGLGEQLPVWGVRRAHRGAEALRVTLYCSFESYEDAVRLYETIARRVAAARGDGGLHVLALRAPGRAALQLGLQRLPPGAAARPCQASLLEFSVREMGRLVPLLPHPCVPISSTRWHTQDYDGNRILLQFQDNSKHSEKSDGFSNQQRKSGPDILLHEPIPVPFPMEPAGVERSSRAPGAVPGGRRAAPAIPPQRSWIQVAGEDGNWGQQQLHVTARVVIIAG